MPNTIKITRGLDIPLLGKAREVTKQTPPLLYYSIFPDDYTGLIPQPTVQEGDAVLAGTTVLADKNRPQIKVPSPVSGRVVAINRGEKRKLESIVVQADAETTYRNFPKQKLQTLTADEVKASLIESGIMSLIRQRPFDIIANPTDTPRDIYVAGFYSTPLAPNINHILDGNEDDFQAGLAALAKMTKGKVYLAVHENYPSGALLRATQVQIITLKGPHPAGNVSVHIDHTHPIVKGDIVWTIHPHDVLVIGRFFNRSVVDMTRLVSLTGSEVNEDARAYYPLLPGAGIEPLVAGNVTAHRTLRYISGNVLTGTQIAANGSLHAFHNQITVIPEGNETHEFVGWLLPAFIRKMLHHTDARVKGGRRAMIMSDEWEKVFPIPIMPEPLIRSILAQEVDKMELLGIYDVVPEDFALCEYVDTSKMELQKIVRQGIDLFRKEMN